MIGLLGILRLGALLPGAPQGPPCSSAQVAVEGRRANGSPFGGAGRRRAPLRSLRPAAPLGQQYHDVVDALAQHDEGRRPSWHLVRGRFENGTLPSMHARDRESPCDRPVPTQAAKSCNTREFTRGRMSAEAKIITAAERAGCDSARKWRRRLMRPAGALAKRPAVSWLLGDGPHRGHGSTAHHLLSVHAVRGPRDHLGSRFRYGRGRPLHRAGRDRLQSPPTAPPRSWPPRSRRRSSRSGARWQAGRL